MPYHRIRPHYTTLHYTTSFMTHINPSNLSVTLVDGYVDEPAHFGVPPYISTYPRFTAGALVDAGVPHDQITYHNSLDG